MLAFLRVRFAGVLSDREGVTAMEYAVIAAVTVLVTATGVAAVSGPLGTLWTNITAAL